MILFVRLVDIPLNVSTALQVDSSICISIYYYQSSYRNDIHTFTTLRCKVLFSFIVFAERFKNIGKVQCVCRSICIRNELLSEGEALGIRHASRAQYQYDNAM